MTAWVLNMGPFPKLLKQLDIFGNNSQICPSNQVTLCNHQGELQLQVCFLHGMVPRGATVRAQTEVDAIAIPPSVPGRMARLEAPKLASRGRMNDEG